MAIPHSSFLFLLLSTVLSLFLFSCLEKVEASRFNAMTANLQPKTHFVPLSSLMPATVCSTPPQGSKNLTRLLQVAHKYGPCSPLKKGKAKIPSHREILINDQNRVKSIHSKISNKDPVVDSTVKLPTTSGESLGSGNFVVKIGLGTPEQDFIVSFDTGSDLTWVQCQPCSNDQCYSQQDPLFNPSASSTYSTISCDSATCTQLQSSAGNPQSCSTTCPYEVGYGDGSYTQGDYSTDTLTLPSSSDVFPKFLFGCGHNNGGIFGSIDGLLGLGHDQVSIVSQTAEKYGKLFSYCLPSKSSSTGFLAFGSDAGSSSTPQYTPLVTNSNDGFYYLNLMGISVNGQSLSIPESVFTTSGTIIDSGTVITRLQPEAYSALRSAFSQAMSKYPTAPSDSLLDTCYDLSGYKSVDLPTIALQFGGGTDLTVDESGILYALSSTQYCLAFAANSDDTSMAILGNTQQKTFEVVYDVAGGKVGFGAGACS